MANLPIYAIMPNFRSLKHPRGLEEAHVVHKIGTGHLLGSHDFIIGFRIAKYSSGPNYPNHPMALNLKRHLSYTN